MPLKYLTGTAIAVTLSAIPFQTMAEEPSKSGVMVDMEGFFSKAHSTPYVGFMHDKIFHALDWKLIRQMIESRDFKGLPSKKVFEACQVLQKTNGKWPDYYNIGKKTLPPMNYPCSKTMLLGKSGISTIPYKIS